MIDGILIDQYRPHWSEIGGGNSSVPSPSRPFKTISGIQLNLPLHCKSWGTNRERGAFYRIHFVQSHHSQTPFSGIHIMHQTPLVLYTASLHSSLSLYVWVHLSTFFKPSVDTSAPITQPAPFQSAGFSHFLFLNISLSPVSRLLVQNFHGTSRTEDQTYHTQ